MRLLDVRLDPSEVGKPCDGCLSHSARCEDGRVGIVGGRNVGREDEHLDRRKGAAARQAVESVPVAAQEVEESEGAAREGARLAELPENAFRVQIRPIARELVGRWRLSVCVIG